MINVNFFETPCVVASSAFREQYAWRRRGTVAHVLWRFLSNFYARQTARRLVLKRVLAIVILSILLSVRPGVTSPYRSKPRWDRDSGFLPHYSVESLVFVT